MKRLLALALKTRRHLALMIVTFCAMIFMTLASQLEIITVGIVTQKSIGAFELFAPVEDNRLAPSETISKATIDERWSQLDAENKGYITNEDIRNYLQKVQRKSFLDRVIASVENILPLSNNIRNLALMIAIVGILKAISLFYHRFTTQLVAIKISRDLRQEYFEHIQRLPMSFYQKHDIGGLSARVVSDAHAIADGINSTLINYIQTPFTVISSLTICFLLSWKLSLLVFLGIPCIIYPIISIAKKVRKISKQLQKNQEHFASVLIDFLGGIQTVKMFSMEGYSRRKYREQNMNMAKLERKSAKYGVSARPIIHTIGMFFLATALLFGLYVLQMTVSEIFVYAGLLMVFYEPIKKFAEENTTIQRGAAAADRMYEVLEIEPDIQDKKNAVTLKEFNDEIAFNQISFKYEDEWVIRGFDLSVKRGQTVAIVGPTGSGKSTLVQLLPRLYEVNQGSITIDGTNINDFTQKSLRDHIAFVPQKPFLFQDTVAENISFGEEFSQEEIESAARQAHAAEFIQRLPKKYAHELSEGGKDLSGGQQQRLAIARALVKKAPILVMDEATSALDAVSEQHIKSAISQLHGKMTQIIIAHRLTTVENADKIVYLDNGIKVAEGTKEELLSSCPAFKEMWETMMRHERKTERTQEVLA